MLYSCDDLGYFHNQPCAEEIITQFSRDWPKGYSANLNWPTWTSRPSTDIDCDAQIARENALGLYGIHGSQPIWSVGSPNHSHASTTSSPADDQFIMTSPSHQFSPPDERGQFLQPTIPHDGSLVCQEPILTGAGVGEMYFPYSDSTQSPTLDKACLFQELDTYSPGKLLRASRTRGSSLRHAPYFLGYERSWNGDSPASAYQCQWSDGTRFCGAVVAHNRHAISHHLQTQHAVRVKADQTDLSCRWGRCRKSMRRESLPRHILAVHMKEKVLCTDCDSRFARTDSLQRHQRTCCMAKEDKSSLTTEQKHGPQ